MQRNYSIVDAVAIKVEDLYCDLHNDFSLCELSVNFRDRHVWVLFAECIAGESARKVKRVILEFIDVDYLDVSSGVLRTMVGDVVELGYKNPEDFDHDWLIQEGKAAPVDHFFLRLSGDEFIRIHSKVAIATAATGSKQ